MKVESKMLAASNAVGAALHALITAIVEDALKGKPALSVVPKAAVEADAVDETEADEDEGFWFPKNFSEFRKYFVENGYPKKYVYAGGFFDNCSAVAWSEERIEFVATGAPEFEANALEPASKERVAAALLDSLGFEGELVIRLSNAGGMSAGEAKPKRTRRPNGAPAADAAAKAAATTAPASKAAAAKSTVTAKEVIDECMVLAGRCGKNAVTDILRQFGGGKVAEIAPAKWADVMNALKNYNETTTATADVSDF